MTQGRTTVWAVVNDELVTGAVGSVARAAIEAWLGDDLREASVFYVMPQPEGRFAWARSRPNAVDRVRYVDVHPAVREACADRLPTHIGRACAREWHDQSPGTMPEGTPFARWRLDHASLPAEGDWDHFKTATCDLLGRNPTETERRAFREALLEHLYDLTPVASDDDE